MKRCLAEKQPERRIAKVCTACSGAPDCCIPRCTRSPHCSGADSRLPISRVCCKKKDRLCFIAKGVVSLWSNTRILTRWHSAELSLTGAVADLQVANHQRPFARPPSPQWSIATVKSLDISSNIPKIVAMDAEDSPWGGMSFLHRLQAKSTLTQSSRCSVSLKFWRKPPQRCRTRRTRSVM